MKAFRLRLINSIVLSTTISGNGSRATRLTSLQGAYSIEASSPEVLFLTYHLSENLPSRRNISASSLKLNTDNTLLPMVNTSSLLAHSCAISQNVAALNCFSFILPFPHALTSRVISDQYYSLREELSVHILVYFGAWLHTQPYVI